MLLFTIIFLYRYLRLFVLVYGYLRARSVPPLVAPYEESQESTQNGQSSSTIRPTPRSSTEKHTGYIPIHDRFNVAVIIPAIDPYGLSFERTLMSCMATHPRQIIIGLLDPNGPYGGRTALTKSLLAICAMATNFFDPQQEPNDKPNSAVISVSQASKRGQICAGMTLLDPTIEYAVFCDDSVTWPPMFLHHLLAPFNDPAVAAVGTQKLVTRVPDLPFISNICNILGALYLDRHNTEIISTSTTSSAVFVISGRTAAYRLSFLHDTSEPNPEARPLHRWQNEFAFFSLLGPLNADDDNFLTRELVKKHRKLAIQSGPAATIETFVGNPSNWLGQCLRWARTTFCSNTALLLTDPARTVWREQRWSVYAIYLAGVTNFALVWNPLLVWALWQDVRETHFAGAWMALLGVWIVASKFVKPWPYYRRHPEDLKYALLTTVLWAYVHSLIKLYELLTFWRIEWGTRPEVDELAAENVLDKRVAEIKESVVEMEHAALDLEKTMVKTLKEKVVKIGHVVASEEKPQHYIC